MEPTLSQSAHGSVATSNSDRGGGGGRVGGGGGEFGGTEQSL